MQSEHLLVRVQDDLYGALRGTDGSLELPYVRNTWRNTMHFSVDCIVKDHAYGRFNAGPDGELKGRFVILADPRGMPAPAGWGQVDSWFRLNSVCNEGASMSRMIAIKNAIIIAPAGSVVPDGFRTVYYEGGLAARDLSVASVFDSLGVEMKEAGFGSWAGHGLQESLAWARESCDSLWPGAIGVHVGPHAGSIDDLLESMGIEGLLSSLKGDRYHSSDDGLQTPYVDLIRGRADSGFTLIERFLDGLPPEEVVRIGPHYEQQKKSMRQAVQQAMVLDAQWEAQDTAVRDIVADARLYFAQDRVRETAKG